MIDVEVTLRQVTEFLNSRGFTPRDADENDLHNPEIPGLRFKTGTVYGEVAVSIWRNNQSNKMETVRIISPRSHDDGIAKLNAVIEQSAFNVANGRDL